MSNCVILTSGYHRNLEKQVHGSVGVARRAARKAAKGGRSKGNKRHMWAVGQAANVSEAHVRSSVTHIHRGVAPSAVMGLGQAMGQGTGIYGHRLLIYPLKNAILTS